jgi:hypothetical protein
MDEAKQLNRQALVSGAVASVLSTAVLALCGEVENGSPAGPINGPSQWIFGRRAARVRKPSLRHTLTGALIHHAMATGWALLHARVFGRRLPTQPLTKRLGRAAVTAVVANIVDFQLTPKRFRPGFETQLSRKSLLAVYAAFAIGLAIAGPAAKQGSLSRRRKSTSGRAG